MKMKGEFGFGHLLGRKSGIFVDGNVVQWDVSLSRTFPFVGFNDCIFTAVCVGPVG